MREISWLAEWAPVSQDGLCFMELAVLILALSDAKLQGYMHRLMVGWIVNAELGRMQAEAVVVYFKVLFRH
jgi:hypothetical protein